MWSENQSEGQKVRLQSQTSNALIAWSTFAIAPIDYMTKRKKRPYYISRLLRRTSESSVENMVRYREGGRDCWGKELV